MKLLKLFIFVGLMTYVCFIATQTLFVIKTTAENPKSGYYYLENSKREISCKKVSEFCFMDYFNCKPNVNAIPLHIISSSAQSTLITTRIKSFIATQFHGNTESERCFKRLTKINSLKAVSWNIQDLGQTKNDKEIEFIAQVLKDFDIIAIQEVVAKHPAGAQKVAQIADELNRTGAKWDYQVSDPTKSPSVYMSERYAFLWKTSKVQLIHRAYLDKELEDKCYREPFIAKFKSKGSSDPFYIINYHSRKYNDRPEEEIIHFLEYPERLNSERIIIAGDFNLTEKHEVWEPFYENGFKNALVDQPTTLKMKCKNNQYLNHAIDNFYYSSEIKQVQSGAIDFIKSCNNLAQGRRISDHLPVYLEFNFE